MIRPLLFFAAAGALALPTGDLAAQGAEMIGYREGRPFSPAVAVGDVLYFSGTLGVTDRTRGMTEGRIQAETRNALDQFQELFAELGIGFEDVVKATVYLTDVEDYRGMNEAWLEYFTRSAPAREAVVVKELVAGAIIEISFIAARP
ncbi:MAG: hypothetical protein GWM92_20965 [Gemmatimonadetes bacterium]|nr:RidA family protein [Gemmatimonadota bacterium]NIR81328.1 RidA family protein [Gemmatimonadota bacterium]NIT90161.1 RidA family protein [Gemmatimonadota bacterium]NIU33993.1 RidA family protein [Gemmatimonadota bacterium]NIU38161.1 hypothetical protein [Gemmatimonadota bacterium]